MKAQSTDLTAGGEGVPTIEHEETQSRTGRLRSFPGKLTEEPAADSRIDAGRRIQVAAKTGEKASSAKNAASGSGTKRPRHEQRRAIETRQAILGAALQEFARRGFDAASMRDIADRIGIQHPLITYHFRTKELLWHAVAQHIMGEVQDEMNARTLDVVDAKPIDRVRAEFRALLSVQRKYPDFHHFMLNESRENSPRLQWLAQNVLAPVVNSTLPEIRRAQSTGDLPPGEPVLLHYMLVGMTSILMSFAAEIEAVTGLSIHTDDIEEKYLTLMDHVMFSGNFGSPDGDTGPKSES